MYGRDAVLPIDNILKPRSRYHGDENHLVKLQAQHEAFVKVHRNLKKTKRKNAEYANRRACSDNFEIGDPVYLKNHYRASKLEGKWIPHFRVIEQLSNTTFRLKNQLTGKVVQSHAEHMRKAKIDWKEPQPDNTNLRTSRFVVPPALSSESSSESANSDVGDMFPPVDDLILVTADSPVQERSNEESISRETSGYRQKLRQTTLDQRPIFSVTQPSVPPVYDNDINDTFQVWTVLDSRTGLILETHL